MCWMAVARNDYLAICTLAWPVVKCSAHCNVAIYTCCIHAFGHDHKPASSSTVVCEFTDAPSPPLNSLPPLSQHLVTIAAEQLVDPSQHLAKKAQPTTPTLLLLLRLLPSPRCVSRCAAATLAKLKIVFHDLHRVRWLCGRLLLLTSTTNSCATSSRCWLCVIWPYSCL
jgi:hypothetical protein